METFAGITDKKVKCSQMPVLVRENLQRNEQEKIFLVFYKNYFPNAETNKENSNNKIYVISVRE